MIRIIFQYGGVVNWGCWNYPWAEIDRVNMIPFDDAEHQNRWAIGAIAKQVRSPESVSYNSWNNFYRNGISTLPILGPMPRFVGLIGNSAYADQRILATQPSFVSFCRSKTIAIPSHFLYGNAFFHTSVFLQNCWLILYQRYLKTSSFGCVDLWGVLFNFFIPTINAAIQQLRR